MKKLLLIFATATISMGSFSFAYADISQLVSTTRNSIDLGSGSVDGIQGIGTGLSGNITGARIYADGTDSGGFSELNVRIYESADATITSGDTLLLSGTIPTISATKTLYQVNFATTTLDSSKHYGIAVLCSNGCGGREDRIYGSTLNVFTNGQNWSQVGSNLIDIYFEVLGTVTNAQENTATRIISVNYPVSVTDTDGYIPFSFTLYSGSPAAASASFLLTNLTTGQSLTSTSTVIISSGQLTFTYSTQLAQYNSYSWQPYIILANGNYIYSSVKYFNTGSSTPSGNNFGNPFEQYLGGQWNAMETINNISEQNGSSTLEGFVNNVFSLQNVMVTKFPFNYFVEIATTLDEILSSSTSTTAYTFAVNFSGNYATSSGASPFSILPTTWTVIAPATMDVYYPESTRNFFRSLLLTVIVVAWGLMMFNRVRFLFT